MAYIHAKPQIQKPKNSGVLFQSQFDYVFDYIITFRSRIWPEISKLNALYNSGIVEF